MIYLVLLMGTGLKHGRNIILQELKFSITFIYTMFFVKSATMYNTCYTVAHPRFNLASYDPARNNIK